MRARGKQHTMTTIAPAFSLQNGKGGQRDICVKWHSALYPSILRPFTLLNAVLESEHLGCAEQRWSHSCWLMTGACSLCAKSSMTIYPLGVQALSPQPTPYHKSFQLSGSKCVLYSQLHGNFLRRPTQSFKINHTKCSVLVLCHT